MTELLHVRRALVSVFDKTGLIELVQGLDAAGVELVSTGSTAAAIRAAGIAVTEVAEVTGFPEILDGRVKTLHPFIHAGLLADRDKPEHRAVLEEHGIATFDLVVGNLYPFARTVADPDVDPGAAIEMIDIGGPSMIRAAAKNHAHVGVVVRPDDYPALLEQLQSQNGQPGGLTADFRRQLAAAAFGATAAYDASVAAWFHTQANPKQRFPERLSVAWRKVDDLRYGENPHQAAAYYVADGAGSGLAAARQHGGKALSYNNLLDTDAAWGMASDFEAPCVVIVKHMNPAGIAVGDSLAEAYPRALAGDPVSAFGGIVAVNRVLDGETAAQIIEVFTEVVAAPGFRPEALEVLASKPNLRVLEIPAAQIANPGQTLRTVSGGLLVADADDAPEEYSTWTVPTAKQPEDTVMAELRFAWQVCKHVKSNGIVLTRDQAVVGVGAGQMSRVDSVALAVNKCQGRSAGTVLASDAFFPFRDGPDAAIAAGVVAMVQPGGSIHDEQTIAACDEAGIPMVFTGRRHFRH